MKKLNIAINGAAGRMGRELVKLVIEAEDMELGAALEKEGHPDLGADSGELAAAGTSGIPVAAEFDGEADVMIDFSLPAGSMLRLRECVSAGVPYVTGTTGFTEEENAEFEKATESIAVLKAANMSLGVHAVYELIARAAEMLGESYDVELVEKHHNRKQDAPSGTALYLVEAVKGARDGLFLHHGRSGKGRRQPGEVGVHALRCGDIVGEHSVIFAGQSEVIEIKHQAVDRTLFASGAVSAARYLAGKRAGAYGMRDILTQKD